MTMLERHRLSLLLPLLASTTMATAAVGCGDDGRTAAKAPLGSPERPLVAQPSEQEGATTAAREPGAATAPKSTSEHKRASEAAAPSAPPGSTSSETGATPGPNYQQLLANQSRRPTKRFSPCNLVTATEAATILGAAMQAPVEAPQGPTCVYRSRSGKRFIALAVQSTSFSTIKPRLRERRRILVSGRAAFCGVYGQRMLYLPLSGGRVLSISAECETAKGFAAKALPHL